MRLRHALRIGARADTALAPADATWSTGFPTSASSRVESGRRLRASGRFSARFGGVALAVLVAGTAMAGGLVVEDRAGTRSLISAVTGYAPAVVHFWATWCGPCLTELPLLARFLDEHPDLAGHIAVVSVDTRGIGSVEAFLADRLGLDITTLRVVEGTPGDAFGVKAYPATILLAADGAVAERIEGSLDWTALETLRRLETHLGR